MRTLDRLYIGGKTRMAQFINGLKMDESGVSSIVATVLLILIVVLLTAIFWDNLQKWFEDIWKRILGESI